MAKSKAIYEPKTGRKGGRLSNQKRLQLLDTIRDKYEKDGRFNKQKTARDLKISRESLNSLIKELEVDMDSLQVVKIDIKQVFERMENRMLFLWDKLEEQAVAEDRVNVRAELNIMKELANLIKEKYKLLQEFGDAPKQADKIDLQADINSKSVNVHFLQEINALK